MNNTELNSPVSGMGAYLKATGQRGPRDFQNNRDSGLSS